MVLLQMTNEKSQHTKAKAVKQTFAETELSLFGEGVTPWRLLSIALAEMIGTALLVFWGCMSVVIGLTHLEISLAFGLAVSSIVTMFGHISCSHVNPSVTVAAVVLGKINIPMAGLYILCQCLGSTLGYKVLLAITPAAMKVATCCTDTAEHVTPMQGVLTEFFLTAILIFLLCGCWDRRNANNMDSVPIKFGLCIAALALVGGKYTGASLNSARSLGPAIWEWNWHNHWIYWLAPLSAGLMTSLFYRLIFDRHVKESYGVASEDIPLNAA